MERDEAIDNIINAFYGEASEICGNQECYNRSAKECRESLLALGVSESEINLDRFPH